MLSNPDSRITFFGQTNYRNAQRRFGIRQADRRAHMYIVGKTGTGKSTLLETMIRQDLNAGQGLALVDPHGDLVEKVLARMPAERKSDLIYFNVPDRAHPLGFNPLQYIPGPKRALAASHLLETFKKQWSEFWGPRTEYILRNALIALLDSSEATLADILRLLDDREFREHTAKQVANAHVRAFWLREYENYPRTFRVEVIAPIQNKVGAFLANPFLHRILTQPKSVFDLKQVMNEGKVLLVNVAKGKIGEDAATLLGALIVTSISVAGLSRADTPENGRRDFFVYLDEFHTFTTLSIATMLSDLRKYHVGLVLSHQYLYQLDRQIREAILGNVGTLISFRIGTPDAQVLEAEFSPELGALDLMHIPNYHIYLRLMVEGEISSPFSAQSIQLPD